MDYLADDRWPWLPEPVREAQRRRKAQHLFIRAAANQAFYAGIAHLGSYGDYSDGKEAHFYLTTRLPRDVWLHLGGFPGWLVEVNHNVHWLDQTEDVAFAALLGAMPLQRFSHLSMTRYMESSMASERGRRRI